MPGIGVAYAYMALPRARSTSAQQHLCDPASIESVLPAHTLCQIAQVRSSGSNEEVRRAMRLVGVVTRLLFRHHEVLGTAWRSRGNRRVAPVIVAWSCIHDMVQHKNQGAVVSHHEEDHHRITPLTIKR